MRKYGTAEYVEEVGDKAVISKRKLQADDLAKVLKKAEVEKTAEVSVGKGRKKDTTAVVTNKDYRVEDEAGS